MTQASEAARLPHDQTAVATPSSNSPGERELILRHAPQGENLYKFQKSKAFVQVLIGPLGSAKTSDAIIKIIKLINDHPPDKNGVRRSRILVMRNTTVDLKATTLKDWAETVDEELGDPIRMDAPITHRLRWRHRDRKTKVRAEVMFVGFDALGDVRKLRGYQLTHLWIDEAKELPKEVVDMALGRLGRYPKETDVPDYPSHALLTSNRPAGDEWLSRLAEDPPKGWDIFIQPGAVFKRNGQWQINKKAENAANLKDEYYERQLGGKKEDWIRQNLGNEPVFVTDGRPVHPEFSQHIHVAKYTLEPQGRLPIGIGADWGRTPAGVFCQRMPNGQVRVLSELTTTNTGIDKFGRAMQRQYNEKYEGIPMADGYGDPSGGGPGWTDDTAFQLFEANAGFPLYPAPSNDPALRFASLDGLLTELIEGEPAIIIDPSCTMLIRGLAGAYHFRRLQQSGYEGRYHEKPEKTPESHVVEGLHYYLFGSGEGERALDQAGWLEQFSEVETDYGGWHPNQGAFE